MKKPTIAILGFVALGLMIRSFGPIVVQADESDEAVVVVTHVDVIPPATAEGRNLLKDFANRSRSDPGSVRLEVFEDLARPNHSTVVEVWKNRKAYDSHLAADHVRAYRAKLQPLLGSPFDERLHRQVQ